MFVKPEKKQKKALLLAEKILKRLGLQLHPNKTRITHVKWGFEFLGYKVKQGKGLKLDKKKIVSKRNRNNIYAYPKDKSIQKIYGQNQRKDKT